MKQHAAPLPQRSRRRLQPPGYLVDPAAVGLGVLPVAVGIVRVGGAQRLLRCRHLPGIAAGADPHMLVHGMVMPLMVVMLVVVVILMLMILVVMGFPGGQQRKPRRRIRHRSGEGRQHIVEKRLRPRTVEQHQIGSLQRDAIGGRQLIIVQTSGGGAGEVFHRHTVHPGGQLLRRHMQGIIGRHHRKGVAFRPAAPQQHCQQHTRRCDPRQQPRHRRIPPHRLSHTVSPILCAKSFLSVYPFRGQM